MESNSYAASIQLPDTNVVFRNIKNAKRFAIDIGGSLTKIAYYSTVSYRRALYTSVNSSKSDVGDGLKYETSEIERVHFIKFETKYIERSLDFIRNHLIVGKESMNGKSIKATGGGAYKYADLIQQKLGLTVEKEDEIDCLIKGCNFLLRNIPDEQFLYCRNEEPEYRFVSTHPDIFPYLLVNIGSGVSIMKVESDNKYERIGGTSIGGGTFWGLGTMLTKAQGFDELLELASQGDHRNVDLLVKDIYGGDYNALGLTADVIASSFGKAMLHAKNNSDFSDADIVRSLLFTVSNDIGQIASLYALLHGLKRIYFGGYFLRNHPVTMHTISYAIRYWSKGVVEALFMRHEGYLGAIGAFLIGTEGDTEKYSWGENYAGSSGLQSPLPASASGFLLDGTSVDQLEMDKCDQKLTYFPLLLKPNDYVPDTVDLTQDKEAREYWISCFEKSLDGYVNQAIKSQQEGGECVKDRAEKFRQKYWQRLQDLKNHPFAYGNLTVRSLLDILQHCLGEVDFPDPYLYQKKNENEDASKILADRLHYIDSLEGEAKQEALIKGILAGNVFDWGAREAAQLMEGGLDFQGASDRLQKRPWLYDNFDLWYKRTKESSHKCAIIFLDNSGCDVVLGIFPFARELLKRNTKVILCANSKPAINDVTAEELEELTKELCKICPVIKEGFHNGTLMIRQSGQASPCLDLNRLPKELCEEIRELGVDLVVIEGMGRALHTNLEVQLTCDVLKLAVIKNQWLAKRLGGDMFAVMCRFEPKPIL